MPSRSTVLMPLAELSSTTSTRPSSSRFTSSTYRMPRLARACKRVQCRHVTLMHAHTHTLQTGSQDAAVGKEHGPASVCNADTRLLGLYCTCVHTCKHTHTHIQPRHIYTNNSDTHTHTQTHNSHTRSYHTHTHQRTSKPGSYALMPSIRAFSMSMVPQMRSSVAPKGSST